MEARTAPSFTTAIRGYDREEVDEYVDSLAKALEDLEASEERSRKLQSHLTRLNARIHELEDRIRTETPHTAGALGERITLLLTAAEEGAVEALERAAVEARDIVERAETEATRLHEEATAEKAAADDVLRTATDRAETQSRAIAEDARARADALVADAERRATSRTRQVEEWEQQVVAHTHAEQALQARAHEEAEATHAGRMATLADQHAEAVRHLTSVRDALDAVVGSAAEHPLAATARAATGVATIAAGPGESDSPAGVTSDDSTDPGRPAMASGGTLLAGATAPGRHAGPFGPAGVTGAASGDQAPEWGTGSGPTGAPAGGSPSGEADPGWVGPAPTTGAGTLGLGSGRDGSEGHGRTPSGAAAAATREADSDADGTDEPWAYDYLAGDDGEDHRAERDDAFSDEPITASFRTIE